MSTVTFLELNDDNIVVHQAVLEITEIEPKEPDPNTLSRYNGRPLIIQPPAPLSVTMTPLASYEVSRQGLKLLDEHPGMASLIQRELPSFCLTTSRDNLNILAFERMMYFPDLESSVPTPFLHAIPDPSFSDSMLESLSRQYGLAVILTIMWMSYYPQYLLHGERVDTIVGFNTVYICEGFSNQRVMMDMWRKNPNMMTYDMMPVAHYRRMKVLNQVIGNIKMKDDEFTFLFVKSDVDTHNPENRYISTTVVTLSDKMSLEDMLQELKDYGYWTPLEEPYQRGRSTRYDTLEVLKYLR